MKRRVFIILGVVVIAAAATGGLLYYTAQNRAVVTAPAGPAAGGPPPTPVLVEPARVADVPIYLDAVGTVQAYSTVTVRAQVEGRLIQVAFREGQDVRRGDVLARIDPTTYQAQLDQAEARVAQDEAQLANARLDLARYTRLSQGDFTTRQQADTQRATVAQLEAQMRLNQAIADNARAVMAYTTITAPIDGRIGLRLVDEGNIVRGSDANGLLVITQMRPISVLFSLPQQHLRAVSTAFAGGQLPVVVTGDDNRTPIDRGMLEVIDNQVDQTTGTVRMKATFPNADLQLWPGQFVNVRLLVRTLSGAIVVPTAAVQRGPDGPFVYVVGADNRASLRRVVVGNQDEVQSVIAENLRADERVITTGFARLTDGARVVITAPPAATPPGTAPPRPQAPQGRPGNRPRGGPGG